MFKYTVWLGFEGLSFAKAILRLEYRSVRQLAYRSTLLMFASFMFRLLWCQVFGHSLIIIDLKFNLYVNDRKQAKQPFSTFLPRR